MCSRGLRPFLGPVVDVDETSGLNVSRLIAFDWMSIFCGTELKLFLLSLNWTRMCISRCVNAKLMLNAVYLECYILINTNPQKYLIHTGLLRYNAHNDSNDHS